MLFICDYITDPEIRAKLEQISKVKSIALGPLCLPNVHPKAKLESPPQFVAGTKDTIVPMLTAPAMNCGMSLFATTLTKDDFSPEFLKEFAANIRREITPRPTRFEIILRWLGAGKSNPSKYDISRNELEEFFLDGAKAAIKKYQLPESELDRMEYRGDVLSSEEKKSIDFKRLVPRSSYTNGRHELGYNFGGNHFLEIQAIETIADAEAASKLGLKEGQLVMMYHGGGGHATYHLGRYFGRRKKNTPFEKAALFVLKCVFHFGSLEGIKHFRIRWRAYFSRRPFPEINANTTEGKRLWQSIQIALNYGYAFRAALLRRINDALPHGSASFIWDAAHNSIMKETVNNEEYFIHRQDAVHVFEGSPIMIMGRNNTLSYLGIGGSEGIKTLNSCTPSATQVVEEDIRNKKTEPEIPPRTTYVSKRKEPELIAKEHITSDGLMRVAHEFEKEGIIKPVAYLRPLGGIKGH